MATVTELSCPYCGKSVNIEEYEQALEKVRLKHEKEYGEQLRRIMEQHRKEKDNIDEKFRRYQEQQQVLINQIKKDVREETKSLYDQEMTDMKKRYRELDLQRQNESAELEEELYRKERNYPDELQRIIVQVREEARNFAECEIEKERDKTKGMEIQIRRAQADAENLKKQLSETQSELKGEVGELNLLDKLKSAFPDDLIERSSRGTVSGDIIHKIRLKSGNILETAIIYDNKNATAVTSDDIDKAKRYMQIHKTEYVIIVSQNLPKRTIKNARLGVKEGVSLAHPSIIVDLVQVIRRGIIEISKLSESYKQENTKQSMLYDYIRSRDFCNHIKIISQIYESSIKLRNDEKKLHDTIWNKREELEETLKKAYMGISSGIDSITQGKNVSERAVIVREIDKKNIQFGDNEGF